MRIHQHMTRASDSATDLLTAEEVVEVLRADPKLRQIAVTCVLSAVRCGNEWRFKRADLEAWIERQRTT